MLLAWDSSTTSDLEEASKAWSYYLPDFDYVVREQEQARVAFGSAQSRAVMPLVRGGASRLANLGLRTTDGLRHLGPGAYSAANFGALYDVLNRVTSERGVGPGARTAARFKDAANGYPAPNAYQAICGQRATPASPSRAPFNTATTRRPLAVSNTPGPGSYTPGAYSSPGVPVAVRCGGGESPGRCEGCLQTLPPGVEFWALEGPVPGLARGTLLCQSCMLNARRRPPRELARFTRWQLDAFKKSRDCSDIHRHEGTRAKILLVDPKTVAKRRRKEAYLAKYFRDHQQPERDPDAMPGTEPAVLAEVVEVSESGAARRDDFCCLHEAFNSFNRERMSFGLGIPPHLIYGTFKRCALDFHPSESSSWSSSSARAARPQPAVRLSSECLSSDASSGSARQRMVRQSSSTRFPSESKLINSLGSSSSASTGKASDDAALPEQQQHAAPRR